MDIKTNLYVAKKYLTMTDFPFVKIKSHEYLPNQHLSECVY